MAEEVTASDGDGKWRSFEQMEIEEEWRQQWSNGRGWGFTDGDEAEVKVMEVRNSTEVWTLECEGWCEKTDGVCIILFLKILILKRLWKRFWKAP